MCKKNIYSLKVSNRGTNVYESVDNITYEVNIPIGFRNNKMSMMTVTDGTIAIKATDPLIYTINELGIESNLPIQGFNSEVQSGFMATNYDTLFDVGLTGFTVGENSALYLTNDLSYRCGALPEKLIFSRYVTAAGTKQPFDNGGAGNSNYISFTLNFEFDD